MNELVVDAKGLSLGWSGREEIVLSAGIDLKLYAGELAVLIGPNGSGKSTLLRTLLGAQAPIAGRVALCGRDVRRLSVEERSRLAAAVFTDRYDSGYFRVFDIVAFGRYPYTDARGRLSEADRGTVLSAIRSVGLGGFERRPFALLSDGEKQKTLIARAVAQDCPLLVLDEPTAFLDAGARVEAFNLARDLARGQGKAVVLSTHDLDHALRFADRIWLMDGRHRFSSGAPEDLAVDGRLGAAFDNELFRFDPGSGAFKPRRQGSLYTVSINGPQGISRAWTERLVERMGLEDCPPGGESSALCSIELEESPGGPLFTLRFGGTVLEAASYEELATALRGITEGNER